MASAFSPTTADIALMMLLPAAMSAWWARSGSLSLRSTATVVVATYLTLFVAVAATKPAVDRLFLICVYGYPRGMDRSISIVSGRHTVRVSDGDHFGGGVATAYEAALTVGHIAMGAVALISIWLCVRTFMPSAHGEITRALGQRRSDPTAAP